MTEPGSSSSDRVVRIEVFLDDRPEAVQIVTAPPFRFQLDTTGLDEGAHSLRVVRIDASGGRRERRIPFHVEHASDVEVRGLEPGATVSGSVEVDVVVPPPPAASLPKPKGPPTWLYLLMTVLILGGIWVFFMVVPIYSNLVPAPSEGGSTASAPSTPAPPVDAALLKAGEQLYTSDCAACHKPSGEGMPPTFPALAGNSFLSDATATVKRIYEGSGAMPSHPSYSAKMLAEVATYIRNTWGNAYGGVSVADAAAAEPSASNTGAAPASGSAPAASSTGSSGASAGSAAGSSSETTPSDSTSSTSAATPSSSAGSTASGASAQPSTTAPAAAAAPSGGIDKATMDAGEQLYEAQCTSCHQANGAGLPPTFPALAGNAALSDATAVVQRIFDGKGIMPAHKTLNVQQLADVATYVRNSWGNAFGPVTAEQAAQAAPKAAQ